MMKLYGFAVSNYFNMVKHALLYKDIAFDEVLMFPGMDPAYNDKSPMGKVPSIDTEHGCLAEASVILNYLENTYTAKPLMPADEWQRAKINELMKMAELYFELPARRLFPEVLAGQKVSDDIKNEVRDTITKGCRALAILAKPSPYMFGETITLADIVLRYCMVTCKLVAQSIYQWDVLADVPGLREWDELMASADISQQLERDSQAGMPAFLEAIKGKV
ncbi:Glutathione S-transferase [Zhongshania aliphaticivorans]|uniref:Glutathione S-transferase n=1 Tax=Zhongshania aliphaticivorans TaxID=1470434 RepID=A0A5S9PQB3_9GAMM|nr:glutathione S-transferase [Zhongshania aliphaticivorans]CAA0106364.1 Glutathione S-transferase [Zhongshania aliphaticivorans]CAA0106516.1 Glutathione S-transferase [Zhongshania aliphaticivorans]